MRCRPALQASAAPAQGWYVGLEGGGNWIDDNNALSLKRATSVKVALVKDGIDEKTISTAGKGEEDPLVPTADGVREPQNRRVQISLQ